MMTSGKLAELSGYILSGDPEIEICGICYAYAPQPGKVVVAMTTKQAKETESDLILTEGTPLSFGKNFLYADDNINMALVKVAKILAAQGTCINHLKRSDDLVMSGGAMISSGATIGNNTTIGAFTVIHTGAVIGSSCHIGNNVTIGSDTIIGDNTTIGDGSRISTDSVFHYYDDGYVHFPGIGRTIIGANVFIGGNTVIQRGTIQDTIISDGCVVGDLVDIGHDCEISENCRIVSQCGISGNVRIGRNSVILGQSGIQNFVRIGENVVVKGKTSIPKDIPDGMTVSGQFGRSNIEELRLQSEIRKLFNERK